LGGMMAVVVEQAEPDPQQVITDLRRQLDDRTAELRVCADALQARTAERDEAFAQQTATAEVLGVINASPGDLAPVFDAMLEKAIRLCEAAYGTMIRFDGENLHVAALHNVPAQLADFLRAPRRVRPGTAADRLNRGERYIHVADVSTEAEAI